MSYPPVPCDGYFCEFRYYYDKLILRKVPGKRYTYRFNFKTILNSGNEPEVDPYSAPDPAYFYDNHGQVIVPASMTSSWPSSQNCPVIGQQAGSLYNCQVRFLFN